MTSTDTNEQVRTITIIGKRWFDKVNGNTYHTSQVMINGVTVHRTPYAYGYGDQYMQSASEWLEANGHITPEHYPSGASQQLWQYCNEHNIHLECSYVDLPRKRDL